MSNIDTGGVGKVGLESGEGEIGAVSFIEFNTNDIEEASATITYIGGEDKDGEWIVKKIDTTSGNSFQYASVTNNPTRTSYDLAWTNRATLTYENYGEAF